MRKARISTFGIFVFLGLQNNCIAMNALDNITFPLDGNDLLIEETKINDAIDISFYVNEIQIVTVHCQGDPKIEFNNATENVTEIINKYPNNLDNIKSAIKDLANFITGDCQIFKNQLKGYSPLVEKGPLFDALEKLKTNLSELKNKLGLLQKKIKKY